MIDKNIIRSNYSRMTDGQLLELANNEGGNLTPAALNILHEEFLNRQLDTSVFGVVEENKSLAIKKNIEDAQNNVANEFTKSIWQYVFDEKKDGTTDESIHDGLLKKGLDNEHANQIINMLPDKAKENLDAHDTEMNTGGLIFIAGIIITFWTLSSANSSGIYIIAFGAIIFGPIRFFRGLSNKDKYKKILANIEIEKNSKTDIVYNSPQ